MISDIQMKQQLKVDTKKAAQSLHTITRILFAIGVIGQWLFAAYIMVAYGSILINGNYEKVNEMLGHGIIPDDSIGNLMLGAHLFLAAVITFGGPLQFFNDLRKKWPVFHRWNGRLYLLIAFLISFNGLYMIITRGAHGGITMFLGNTLNAVLIMTFCVFTLTTALQKDFSSHKKWALRAFLLISGVWFFRIGYGLWILITGFTAPGTSSDLNGPFDIFLTFGHSIIPLLILEFYFFAKTHSSLKIKRAANAFFSLLCLLLTGGIIRAAMIFWVPQL